MFTAVVFAFLFTQTAFLGHDAAHRQIFRSGKWNDWVSLILGGFVGMSYGWWQHKHTRHHANPNKIGVDPDIDLPGRRVHARAGRTRRRTPFIALGHRAPGRLLLPDPAARGALAARVERAPRARTRAHRPPAGRDRLPRRAHRRVPRAGLPRALARQGRRVPRDPARAVRLLHGHVVRAEPQGHAARAEGHEARLPAPPGADEPQHPRQSRCSTSSWAASTTRSSTTSSRRCPGRTCAARRRSSRRTAASTTCRTRETTFWHSYAIVLRYINRVGLGERDPFECPLVVERASI